MKSERKIQQLKLTDHAFERINLRQVPPYVLELFQNDPLRLPGAHFWGGANSYLIVRTSDNHYYVGIEETGNIVTVLRFDELFELIRWSKKFTNHPQQAQVAIYKLNASLSHHQQSTAWYAQYLGVEINPKKI